MIDADIPKTVSREAFIGAISVLKAMKRRAETDPEVANSVKSIVAGRESVLPRFQPIFARDQLDSLREEDFRDFLIFKNNKHWKGLQRMGPSICADMNLLRSGLEILLDEDRPLADRLNELVPTRGAAYVPRLSRAVLTPILLVAHPDRYGVWNNVSEAAIRSWPTLAGSWTGLHGSSLSQEIFRTTA